MLRPSSPSLKPPQALPKENTELFSRKVDLPLSDIERIRNKKL
jgi:hypothetical protein